MKGKILHTTVFTGYNFGSSLQTLAVRIILENMGYDCTLVARRSLAKGRDIRIGKLITILWRSFILRNKTKSISTYQKSYNKELVSDSATRF